MIVRRCPTRSHSVRIAAALSGVCCLALVGVGLAIAASGDFDRSFSGDGIAKTGFGPGGHGSGFANAVAVQANDRIVIAGAAKSGDFGLARFRRSGKLDRSFGNRGTVRIDFGGDEEFAEDVAVRRDGRIVVVGLATVGDRFEIGIARLRPSGALDSSFSDDGRETLDPFADPMEASPPFVVALQSGGRILAGGQRQVRAAQDFPGFVTRLKPDGDLDPSFADGGVRTINFPRPGATVDTDINELIVDAHGRIAVGGTRFDPSDELSARGVMARLRPDGDFDSSFSGDGRKILKRGVIPRRDSALLSIAAAPHGRLMAAGRAGNGILIVRVKGSGAFDRSFAGDGVKTTRLDLQGVNAPHVMVQRNGKPLLAATFEKSYRIRGAVVARLRPNGHFDHSFSGDGRRILKKIERRYSPVVTDAAMQANGKILLTAGPDYRRGLKSSVARLKNDGRPFVTP